MYTKVFSAFICIMFLWRYNILYEIWLACSILGDQAIILTKVCQDVKSFWQKKDINSAYFFIVPRAQTLHLFTSMFRAEWMICQKWRGNKRSSIYLYFKHSFSTFNLGIYVYIVANKKRSYPNNVQLSMCSISEIRIRLLCTLKYKLHFLPFIGMNYLKLHKKYLRKTEQLNFKK